MPLQAFNSPRYAEGMCLAAWPQSWEQQNIFLPDRGTWTFNVHYLHILIRETSFFYSTIYNLKKVKTEMTFAPLKFIKIKNPFGFLQSSPSIHAEQVEPIFFIENIFSWNTLLHSVPM